MQNGRRVVGMVVDVIRVGGELTKVMREGPLNDEGAQRRGEDLPRKRAKERSHQGVLTEAVGENNHLRYKTTRGRLYG